MQYEIARRATVGLCVLVLALGPVASPLLAQSSSVTGRVAGQVIDGATGMPVAGARLEAKRVTTNEVFESPGTDALGGYLIAGVPAGIYAVEIVHDGSRFAVEERFDVRVGMSYLLEACFELDRPSRTASIRETCTSGLYAQNQVVSLGAGRYFRPDLPPATQGAGAQLLTIAHAGLGCISSDVFPQLDAEILREVDVSVARVYFRAAQYPDFYYIEMSPAASGFRGIFPRPSPDTREIVYYVEALDTAYNPVQSNEYTAPVMSVEECRKKDPAATFFTGNDPGITVGATIAGAAAQPPGFLATGIASFISASGTVTGAAVAGGAAAGGGGIGTLGIILIVGAAAGATAGVVLTSTGEDEASKIR